MTAPDWPGYAAAAGREVGQITEAPGQDFPHYSEAGRWVCLDVDKTSAWLPQRYEHGNWTAGFWYGTAWLAALAGTTSAEPVAARLHLLDGRANDHTTHDLGFLFYPAHVLGHLLGYVADPSLAIAAADMLIKRFNHAGRYIQAFGPIGEQRSAGTSTIDTMMNLPLLWWAARHSSEPHYFEVARQHARTSARLLVRGNGSATHLMRLDAVTGAYLGEATLQGASPASSWSRGVAWAAAGMAWAYAETGESEFLQSAERSLGYFDERSPPIDGLPSWDFSDTDPGAARDASAGAGIALAHELLAGVHPDRESRNRHHDRASERLGTLCDLALNRSPDVDGILLMSSYSVPHGLGVDGATAWGDFFFGLALALHDGAVSHDVLIGDQRFRSTR